MIIDAHVHVHPYPNGLGAKYDASPAQLLTELDSDKIGKVVLLPIEPEISTEFVYNVALQRPDKIIPFGSVDPQKYPYSLKQIDEYKNKFGIKGLKLHPRRQNVEPGDKRVVGIVKTAAEIGLPILFDCLPWGHDHIKYNHPAHYDRLAREIPEAKIILAHCGGTYLFDAFTVAKANSNIFLDISLVLLYYKGCGLIDDIGFCIKKLGADRIIYGSDYPQYGLIEYFNETMNFLGNAGISTAEKELIFGGNMLRLLGVGHQQ